MRYEAGNCTVVVSIERAFQNDVLNMIFHLSHIFAKIALDQRHPWFFMISGQIQPTAKWTSLECSVHADHNGANPSFIYIAQDS